MAETVCNSRNGHSFGLPNSRTQLTIQDRPVSIVTMVLELVPAGPLTG